MELREKDLEPVWDLRGLRERANMTQSEAAARMGYSIPAVNQWEKGLTSPAIDKLPKIAAVLDVTMDELVPALIRTRRRASSG